VPLAFNAVTVNVYAVPFVSPVTLTGLAEFVPVIDPGLEVAVYVVTVFPPLAPGVNVMLADWNPPVAVPIVGA
jgi:hypothetical protein